MRVSRSLVLTALIAMAAGGCSMFESATPTNVTPIIPKGINNKSLPFPFDHTMVAVSFKGQPFNGDRPSILVSANFRGTGFSACNNWSATIIPRTDQAILVGPIAISKRVCEARLMHNEQVFLYVLQSAKEWSFVGRYLTIKSQYGDMVFEAAA